MVKGGNEVNEGGGEAYCKVVPVSAGSQGIPLPARSVDHKLKWSDT